MMVPFGWPYFQRKISILSGWGEDLISHILQAFPTFQIFATVEIKEMP